jgi:very-short-patch-repair endonuclease
MRARQSLTHPSKSRLQVYASRNRAALTASEARLWSALSAGQLGVSFRRQVPLGNFIADFFASRARLVVEVDGSYHERRRSADAHRDSKLRRLGYRVLRFQPRSS